MPGPVIGNPIPQWMRPENASVLDPWYVSAARSLAQLAGLTNPQSQVLSTMMPLQLPEGNLATLGRGIMGKLEAAASDYGGSHRPPGVGSGAPLHDLTGGGTVYPDDVYSVNGPRYYGTGGGNDPVDRASFRIVNAYRGKPDAAVTIYRAVPNDPAITEINPGDWVTINRQYAEDHGERWVDEGGYKILSKKVKASDIFTNGDSIHEWGYHPPQP